MTVGGGRVGGQVRKRNCTQAQLPMGLPIVYLSSPFPRGGQVQLPESEDFQWQSAGFHYNWHHHSKSKLLGTEQPACHSPGPNRYLFLSWRERRRDSLVDETSPCEHRPQVCLSGSQTEEHPSANPGPLNSLSSKRSLQLHMPDIMPPVPSSVYMTYGNPNGHYLVRHFFPLMNQCSRNRMSLPKQVWDACMLQNRKAVFRQVDFETEPEEAKECCPQWLGGRGKIN